MLAQINIAMVKIKGETNSKENDTQVPLQLIWKAENLFVAVVSC